jgi:2-methylisocitrate lyase-like PEP mutase family enzyme
MEQARQQQLATTFHQLHKAEHPLILFNVWDVATAKAVGTSASAIATSSGAVASALGFADGEQAPLETVVALVSRLTAAVKLPVSIDLEAGYGDSPQEAARSVLAILNAGAIGINLEDGLFAGQRRLVSSSEHAAKIKAVRCAAQQFGIDLFINARTDPFLAQFGSPSDCLDEAVRRAKVYADVGADGIFVPGLSDLASIETLVRGTHLPVNIMVTRGFPTIVDLANVGVRRVSLGPWPMLATMRAIGAAAAEVAASRQYGAFLVND